MEEQLELEATIQQEMAASGDFVEGVQAFLAKRPAGVQGGVTPGAEAPWPVYTLPPP